VKRAATMQPGATVQVYRDPVTEQHSEGTARLLYPTHVYRDGLEVWVVRFVGDEGPREVYARTIKPPVTA